MTEVNFLSSSWHIRIGEDADGGYGFFNQTGNLEPVEIPDETESVITDLPETVAIEHGLRVGDTLIFSVDEYEEDGGDGEVAEELFMTPDGRNISPSELVDVHLRNVA